MKHKACSNTKEVPYCFSRSSMKFQGHTGQKIADFDPNWAFPDCNSSLNSPMDLKWCTKLDVVSKRCPIIFLGRPSNFKVTQAEKSTVLIQLSTITRPVAAIESLRFAFLCIICNNYSRPKQAIGSCFNLSPLHLLLLLLVLIIIIIVTIRLCKTYQLPVPSHLQIKISRTDKTPVFNNILYCQKEAQAILSTNFFVICAITIIITIMIFITVIIIITIISNKS